MVWMWDKAKGFGCMLGDAEALPKYKVIHL